MQKFRFTLTDYTTNPLGDSTIIDEPVGWDGLEMKLSRNKSWHGFFDYFDDAISTLEFDGTGFAILKAAWESQGIAAKVTLLIEFACSDNDSYEEIYTGNFDFGKYERICSDRCYIKINVETTSCLIQLKNRYEQTVNLDSLRTFDLADGDPDDLTPYTGLGFDIMLQPQDVEWSFNAEMENYPVNYHFTDTTSHITGNSYGHFYTFELTKVNDKTFVQINNMDSVYNAENALGADFIEVTPGLILFEIPTKISCFGNFDIVIDVDGTFTEQSGDSRHYNGALSLVKVPEGTTTLSVISQQSGLGGSFAMAITNNKIINWHDTISMSLSQGDKIYLFLALTSYQYTTGSGGIADPFNLDIQFTQFKFSITGLSSCEATKSKVYLVNEVASRIAESITGDCLRVYSDYFGRPDAQPYTSDEDGCGSQEVLTNGLNIRRAYIAKNSLFGVKGYEAPDYLLSMKQLFEGLNAIHNIGMGVEDDPNRAGYQLLRIEKFQHFYTNTVLLTLNNIAQVKTHAHPETIYSVYKGGYEKSETETPGGRYDMMTKRNFRTTLSTISNVLNKVCPFIASGHSIEVTRWQVGATSEDWRYDTDTFIICVRHDAEALNGYRVQRGEDVPTAENLPNYESCYNILISPQRNARRWVPIVFQCYVDYVHNTLKFMDGAGNFIASTFLLPNHLECEVQDDSVPWQNMPENADISLDTDAPYPFDAQSVANYYPIFKPERVTFEYPLTYAQWKTIKAHPTGLIGYQCGNGTTEYGWIDELNYKPVEGMAEFTLIPKQPELLSPGGG